MSVEDVRVDRQSVRGNQEADVRVQHYRIKSRTLRYTIATCDIRQISVSLTTCFISLFSESCYVEIKKKLIFFVLSE